MNANIIIQLLCAWLQGKRLPPLPEGITKLTTPQNLNGFLYHTAPEMSACDAGICAQTWQKNAALHLKRLKILQQVWPVDAPRPMLFKGADYCEQLYRDPGARGCCDADFLVPSHFEAIARHLAKSATEIRYPQQMRLPFGSIDSLGFVIDGCLLELHRQIVPLPPNELRANRIWHRSQPDRTAGDPFFRFPCPKDRLAIWLAQAAKDAFEINQMQLIDLMIILRQQTDPILPWLRRCQLLTAYQVAQQMLKPLQPPINLRCPLPNRLQAQVIQQLLPSIWGPVQSQPSVFKRDLIKILSWHPRAFGPKLLAALWHRLDARLKAKIPAQK